MTPQDVITQVRRLIQDDTVATQRYSDAVLLGFVNQVLTRMVHMRPDLFIYHGVVPLVQDTVSQNMPSGSVRLLEVFQVEDGDAVTEVNRETLDQMYPAWRNDTAGTPCNWIRHPRNPNGYMVWPRPSVPMNLLVEYVKSPATYLIGDTITELASAYLSVLIDGTCWLAESVDAEHVEDGRAKMHYEAFVEALAADFSQRAAIDSEGGAVGAQQKGPPNAG